MEPWWKSMNLPSGDVSFGLQEAKEVLTQRVLLLRDLGIKATVVSDHSFGVTKQSKQEVLDLIAQKLGIEPTLQSEYNVTYVLENGLFYVNCSRKEIEGMGFVSIDKELSKICKELLELMSVQPESGTVFVLANSASGIQIKPIGVAGVPLVEGNYSPETVVGINKVKKDLSEISPTGRLSVLNGPPGSGKTHIIRGLLLGIQNISFVICPADLVTELGSPQMLPTLIEFRQRADGRIVFIIEDADNVLVSRDASNMSAISSVLNLCDGILGSLLDIRILATTNAKKVEIDKALLRPGRLSAHVEVGALSYEQSKKRLAELNPEAQLPEVREYTIAEIYLLSKENTVKPVGGSKPAVKIGFGS